MASGSIPFAETPPYEGPPVEAYPGWPEFPGKHVSVYGSDPRETDSISDCDTRVSRLYLALGMLNLSLQDVQQTAYRGDYVAGTTLPEHNPNCATAHGFASWGARVEIRAGGVDTVHHELTHAHDIFLRKSPSCHHFYEEGTAVAFEWILHKSEVSSVFGSESITTLRLWDKAIPTGAALRDKVARIDASGIMRSESYPLAGFVMIQIVSSQGGPTVNRIIHCSATDKIPELPIEFWDLAKKNMHTWCESR